MATTKPQQTSPAHFSAISRSLIVVIPVAVAIIFSSLYLGERHMTDASQQQTQSTPTSASHMQQDATQPSETPLSSTPQPTTTPDIDPTPSLDTPTSDMPPHTLPDNQSLPQAMPHAPHAILRRLTNPVTQTWQLHCQPTAELGGGMSNDASNDLQQCLL